VEVERVLAVIGGTGLYELFESEAEKREITTPYGKPSAAIAIGEIAGKKVAFLPRHGKKHEFPPHKIPYKANLFALKQLGVTRVIAPCAVGSLKPEIKPGDFVIADQVVNFTKREDTFYDGPETIHISFADPFCPELRSIVIDSLKELGLSFHPRGTAVVIQGPRFSTRAESEFYQRQGWDIINMTMYPECVLARELEMCYVNISIVTDYDVGLKGRSDIKPVTAEEVLRVFKANIEKLKELLKLVIAKVPEQRSCECSKALEKARL